MHSSILYSILSPTCLQKTSKKYTVFKVMLKRTEEYVVFHLLMWHLISNPTAACIQSVPPFHFSFVSFTLIRADWAKPIITPLTIKKDTTKKWMQIAFGTVDRTYWSSSPSGHFFWVIRDPDADFDFIDWKFELQVFVWTSNFVFMFHLVPHSNKTQRSLWVNI